MSASTRAPSVATDGAAGNAAEFKDDAQDPAFIRQARLGGPPSPPAHPSIAGLPPYTGAKQRVTGRMLAKLDSNEGALGMPPQLRRALAPFGDMHRYPDSSAEPVRRALGREYGIDPDHIVCNNGSEANLVDICRIYAMPQAGVAKPFEVVMNAHSFCQYAQAAQQVGAVPVGVPGRGVDKPGTDRAGMVDFATDVDAMLAAVTPQTRVVFLANPDNPSGAILPWSEVERLHAGLRKDVILFLDAAYEDFVDDPEYHAGDKLVGPNKNVVVSRTLSKAWQGAGMRLGWLHVPETIKDKFNRGRPPYNVGVLPQGAAQMLLQHPELRQQARDHNFREREIMQHRLQEAELDYWPSQGNFVRVNFHTAEHASRALEFCAARGVSLRDQIIYGEPHIVRVSIGATQENDLAADALDAFAEQHGARPGIA